MRWVLLRALATLPATDRPGASDGLGLGLSVPRRGRSCGHRVGSNLSSRPTTTWESTMTSDTTHAPPTANSPPATPVAPPVPAPPRHPRRLVRWAIWCAVGGLAIVAAYFGISWWTYRLSHSITDDAFVEAHIVNVAPEMVSGRIVRFLVEENDRVEQGQLLAEIDPVHYR